MELAEFSVTNFRSITKAHRIKMSKFTVLVGKNNEGKSNFLLSLNIALMAIKNYSILNPSQFNHRQFRQRIYDWSRDFPIQLQKKSSNSKSIFRCKFVLNDDELLDFHSETKLNGNNTINVHIEYGKDNIPSIKIPKQSTNSYNDNVTAVTEYISKHLHFYYIPTIRTEEMVRRNIEIAINSQLQLLHENKKYIAAINTINKLETETLNILSNNLKLPLKMFIPKLNDVRIDIENMGIENRIRFPMFSLKIDDGQLTEIDYKGDGIKSLVTLAIINQHKIDSGSSIIAIEEPESHLHPEAMHNLVNIINDISKNSQVIITTHNPLFVQRNFIDSNIIVNDGEVRAAKNIEEIRQVLGVYSTDNLYNTQYVLLVEGEDDKKSLTKILSLKSSKIYDSLLKNIFSIKPMNGASNLTHDIIELKNNLCTFMVLLDNDIAGIQAFENAKRIGIIDDKDVKFTICNNMINSEFEDCIKENFYCELFKEKFGVDVRFGCKNKKEKWSDRMKNIFKLQGNKWDEAKKKEVKETLATSIKDTNEPLENILISEKSGFIDSLVSNLESILCLN